MAWGSKEELIRVQSQLEAKDQELQFLRDQVSRLQEALFSQTAPVAYADMQAAKLDETTNPAIKEKQEEARVASEYISQIEKPFFDDVSDAISKLSSICGVKIDKGSLHGNEES